MPKILQALLAPYMMGVVDASGGGGAPAPDTDDAARQRGDIVDDADDAADTRAATDKAVDDNAEGAEGAAGDDEADPAPARKPVMIPKARFDDARRKDRERIRQLEEQISKAPKDATPTVQERVSEIEVASAKLMEDYAKALDDGDTKKAAQIMTQVRQLDRDAVRIETAAVSARDRAIAVEQVRLDMLIDTLEEKYPQLKEGSDDYDADLVEEIGELRSAFEARGYSSSEALKRAMKYALREDGAGTTAQIDKDVDKAATVADKAAAVARDRKAEAVRRNLKVANGGQPGDTNKAPGLDSHQAGSGGVSVADMSDKDFDALPDATKRKLRGDYFAPTMQ